MKQLIPIGMIVIFIGMILIFIGALSSVKDGKTDAKVAVGGFIGFIPFGFGNDKKLMYFAMGLTAVMFFVWILFYLLR